MKLLIHAINGIGLGHVIRTSRIAGAFKDLQPECDIIYVTNTKYNDYLKKRYKTYTLSRDTRGVIEGRYTYQEYLNYNTRSIIKIIAYERPDIVLFDSELNKDLLEFCKLNSIKAVYVLRITTLERFNSIKENLPLFDSVIVPHDKSEFQSDQKEYLSKINAQFTGPIVDTNDYSGIERQANILITLGSGALIPDNQPLYRAVDNFLEALRCNNSMIDNKPFSVKIVTGPFYEGNCNLNDFTAIKSVETLMDLMLNSSIVISGAGYNTINEIIYTKTPAVVIPLLRKWDNQFQRAEKLAQHGCIKVAQENLYKHVCEILINWQAYHNRFPIIKAGNKLAAKTISEAACCKA